MTHPSADADVFVVNNEGQADQKVFVINNEILNISAGAGDLLVYENGAWTARTLVDADVPSAIARDTEVATAIATSESGQVRDGDAAGGVLGGTYPNPAFAADMATQAELDAAIASEVATRAAAVTAEATTRAAAVTAEATTRAAADATNAGLFKIAQVLPDGSSGSIDFSSISGSYESLVLEGMIRTDEVATASTVFVALNGDTTNANYDDEQLQGVGGTASASENLITRQIGVCPAASATANQFGFFRLVIIGYASTSFFKIVDAQSRYWSARTTGTGVLRNKMAQWVNTAAVNEVTLSLSTAKFISGSRVNLYGVKAAA